MKRMTNRGLVIAAAVLLGAGSAAGRAWGADEKPVRPVRIGIVPSQSVKALMEQHQPLLDYLSSKTGRAFELRPNKTYEEIVEQLKAGDLDGGVFGSFVSYQAIREISAVPAARPEKKGVSTYRGLVLVRKDSGIGNILDMKGKSFDFVSRSTSAGYVYPRALLKAGGIDAEGFFSSVTYAGKHDIAVMKVLNRDCDGAAVKDVVYEKVAAGDPRVAAELSVIHTSERFPEGTIMFRKETPKDLVKAVREALLAADADPSGRRALEGVGADRYIETTAGDFAYLRKLMGAAEEKK